MSLNDYLRKLTADGRRADRRPSPAEPPSFDLGSEDIEATGESFYTESIGRIFAAAGRPLGGVIMRTASLVPDPRNEYDQFAVGVYVDGFHVGWIPSEDAPQIQPVVQRYAHRTGQWPSVLTRAWACCENGHWSARVTLSLSGDLEQEWSYVDTAPWPGEKSPDGTQRLTQNGRIQRIQVADEAGLVRGQDFETLRPDIAEAKAAGDSVTALRLLTDCIDAAERRAAITGYRPASWPTEQAAILLRATKDYAAEVAVVERFINADPTHQGTQGLRDRLTKAGALAGRPATGDLAPRPVARSDDDAPTVLELQTDAIVTVVNLRSAAEVSYETKHKDAIRSIFARANVALGSALETRAILKEIPASGTHYWRIAVYVDGNLIGQVGAFYADAIRELLREPSLAGQHIAVPCRIYARETPSWSVRATLGPYESVVASLEDTQSAAEGRANQQVMAQLRLQHMARGGSEAIEQSERLVRGKDFVEWVEHIKQLRRDGRDGEAMDLLMECIECAERDAVKNGWQPPTWYTEQAAIMLRKRGDVPGEVALLERFVAACPLGKPQTEIAERLVKARAKLH